MDLGGAHRCIQALEFYISDDVPEQSVDPEEDINEVMNVYALPGQGVIIGFFLVLHIAIDGKQDIVGALSFSLGFYICWHIEGRVHFCHCGNRQGRPLGHTIYCTGGTHYLSLCASN